MSDAHHAYISQDGGGLKVDILNLAFQQKVLDHEYLRPVVGWRRQMGTEFTKIIQFVHTTPPPPQSSGSPLSASTGGGSPHPHLRNRAPLPPPTQSGSRPPQSTRGTSGSPHPHLHSRALPPPPHPQLGSRHPQLARGSVGHHSYAGTS